MLPLIAQKIILAFSFSAFTVRPMVPGHGFFPHILVLFHSEPLNCN